MADRRQCASVAAAIAGLAFLLSACAALAPDGDGAPVPVLVVGNEDGVNPHLIRRDTPRFRETVYANFEKALAQYGFRAVGEEAFRGRFDLNRGGGGPWGRWLDEDFLAGAKRLSADGSGVCIPFLVTVRVYVRIWHNRPDFLNFQPDVAIFDAVSGERIGRDGLNVDVPLPSYCPPNVCIDTMYRASSAGIFRPLGEAVARKLADYRARDRSGRPARRCG